MAAPIKYHMPARARWHGNCWSDSWCDHAAPTPSGSLSPVSLCPTRPAGGAVVGLLSASVGRVCAWYLAFAGSSLLPRATSPSGQAGRARSSFSRRRQTTTGRHPPTPDDNNKERTTSGRRTASDGRTDALLAYLDAGSRVGDATSLTVPGKAGQRAWGSSAHECPAIGCALVWNTDKRRGIRRCSS